MTSSGVKKELASAGSWPSGGVSRRKRGRAFANGGALGTRDSYRDLMERCKDEKEGGRANFDCLKMIEGGTLWISKRQDAAADELDKTNRGWDRVEVYL